MLNITLFWWWKIRHAVDGEKVLLDGTGASQVSACPKDIPRPACGAQSPKEPLELLELLRLVGIIGIIGLYMLVYVNIC